MCIIQFQIKLLSTGYFFLHIETLHSQHVHHYTHSMLSLLEQSPELKLHVSTLLSCLVYSNLFNLPITAIHRKLTVIMTRKTILLPHVL